MLFYSPPSFVPEEVLGSESQSKLGGHRELETKSSLGPQGLLFGEPKGLVLCVEISNDGYSNRWEKWLLGGLKGTGVRVEGGVSFGG